MIKFRTIIIADGEIPDRTHWPSFHQAQLICTDGAALTLQRMGIEPHFIIGDLDTLLSKYHFISHLKGQFPNTKIVNVQHQDTTDFEKAINYTITHLEPPILCLGMLGRAFDHSLHNLCLFADYASKSPTPLDWLWLHEHDGIRQWGFILPKKCIIGTKTNQIISFFPMPEATLTSTGLKWELNNTRLSQVQGHSVRNKTINSTLTLNTKGLCFAILTQSCPPHIQVTI